MTTRTCAPRCAIDLEEDVHVPGQYESQPDGWNVTSLQIKPAYDREISPYADCDGGRTPRAKVVTLQETEEEAEPAAATVEDQPAGWFETSLQIEEKYPAHVTKIRGEDVRRSNNAVYNDEGEDEVSPDLDQPDGWNVTSLQLDPDRQAAIKIQAMRRGSKGRSDAEVACPRPRPRPRPDPDPDPGRGPDPGPDPDPDPDPDPNPNQAKQAENQATSPLRQRLGPHSLPHCLAASLPHCLTHSPTHALALPLAPRQDRLGGGRGGGRAHARALFALLLHHRRERGRRRKEHDARAGGGGEGGRGAWAAAARGRGGAHRRGGGRGGGGAPDRGGGGAAERGEAHGGANR